MVLEFTGISPKYKSIRLGVIGNNKVDEIRLIIDRYQNGIDLSWFNVYLKVQNKDFSFCDLINDILVAIQYDKIELTYLIPETISTKKHVDVQVCFKKNTDDDILIWQSQVFNITFNKSIELSEDVSEYYPNILKEMEKQIKDISKTINQTVTQYKSKLFFPNVGSENAIYVDSEDNRSYRYDSENNYYYCVGSDYDDISIINGNGGNE